MDTLPLSLLSLTVQPSSHPPLPPYYPCLSHHHHSAQKNVQKVQLDSYRPRPTLNPKMSKPHHFRKKEKNNSMPSGDAIQSAAYIVFLRILGINPWMLILFHLLPKLLKNAQQSNTLFLLEIQDQKIIHHTRVMTKLQT